MPKIPGDENQLQQLFECLINNTIKFRGPSPAKVRIGCKDSEEGYEITIADNGIGIDPSEQEQIFEIFHQLGDEKQYPGSGIGLAIARKIVEYHGGRIRVESQLGGGSTFYINFAVKKNQQ